MPVDKAKTYSIIKYGLSIVDTCCLIVILCLFQGLGLARILARYLAGSACPASLVFPVYLAVVGLAYSILNFPLAFYQSFILEHNFQLSNQKVADWLKDQMKSGLIIYVMALIMFGALYYVLGRFPDTWWLIVSAVWILLSVVMAKLFPVIIIPLFFKSKPLADEVLRERIIALARKMQVCLLNVFEIDFSKKTL